MCGLLFIQLNIVILVYIVNFFVYIVFAKIKVVNMLYLVG